MGDACTCCGRHIPGSPVRQIHLDCWCEHHSDPTGPWPPDHVCAPDLPATPKETP